MGSIDKLENIPGNRRNFLVTLAGTSLLNGCQKSKDSLPQKYSVESLIEVLDTKLSENEKQIVRENWKDAPEGAIKTICDIYLKQDKTYEREKLDGFNTAILTNDQVKFYSQLYPWIKNPRTLTSKRQNGMPSPDEIAIYQYERLITSIISSQ